MRKVMIGTAVLLMMVACGDPDGVSTSGDDGLEGRTFLSESVADDGQPRELVEGTRISLEFGDDGQLSAHAGCNHLFTDVTIGPDTLETTGVGGTEMGCDPERHDQDAWLAAFLESSPAWALDGDQLTLTSGSAEIVMLDRRVADPDRPLAGTRWVVDTIVSGETASSMWAGTEGDAWLLIDDDGSVTAHSGCREFTARVEIGDDTLAFSDTVQTDPACPPELVEIDEVMTAVLTGEVGYGITAARLQIDHPDGVGLGLHADE